ncbi:MAG: Na+/H+ antiporter subunit E [bacterium]
MKRIILFIVAFLFWLLVTSTLDWQHLLIGTGVAFLVAFLFGNIFVQQPKKSFQIKRYLWFCYYVPIFLWECIKANFDVAYRVLHPRMPIHPGIVKVKTQLKSDMAKACLANSITMTPGTLSVDTKDEYLYIHWINVRSQEVPEATKLIVGRFEKILAKIFD